MGEAKDKIFHLQQKAFMKKIIISVVQFLLVAAGFGVYVYINLNKKYPLAHLTSEPKSVLKYDIQYLKENKNRLNNNIKVLLTDIHESLKSDLAQSDIYNFNKQDCTPYLLKYPYAYQVLHVYKDVYFYSNGLYDPTLEVFFKKIRDNSIIQMKNLADTDYKKLFLKSKPYVGFDYVMVNSNRLKKLKPGVCLNLDSCIRACQAKNLSEFFKSQSIKNFYFILNREIVTNGFRDGKKKLWNVVYSVPVQTYDEENHVHNKKVKVVFNLKDKSISAFNNTKEVSSLENFYVEDLQEFEKCAEEMRSYIKQCKFVFYKNSPQKNTINSLEKILIPKLTKENRNLFQKALKERKDRKKRLVKSFCWAKEGRAVKDVDVLEKFLNSQKKIDVLRDDDSRNAFYNVLKKKKIIEVSDFDNKVDNCVFKLYTTFLDSEEQKFLQEQSLKTKLKVYVLNKSWQDKIKKVEWRKDIFNTGIKVYKTGGKSEEEGRLKREVNALLVEFLKSDEMVKSCRENYQMEKIVEKKVEKKKEEKFEEDAIDKFCLNFVLSESYMKGLRKNYEMDEREMNKKMELKDIQIDDSKRILINPMDGGLTVSKFICGFVISDNPILSKCLSLSCNINNFATADEIFKNFKNHQCEYFVLYQDEEKKLQYRSSKQLKVKIDNYRYTISL